MYLHETIQNVLVCRPFKSISNLRAISPLEEGQLFFPSKDSSSDSWHWSYALHIYAHCICKHGRNHFIVFTRRRKWGNAVAWLTDPTQKPKRNGLELTNHEAGATWVPCALETALLSAILCWLKACWCQLSCKLYSHFSVQVHLFFLMEVATMVSRIFCSMSVARVCYYLSHFGLSSSTYFPADRN